MLQEVGNGERGPFIDGVGLLLGMLARVGVVPTLVSFRQILRGQYIDLRDLHAWCSNGDQWVDLQDCSENGGKVVVV
jgi:hypothetical protein